MELLDRNVFQKFAKNTAIKYYSSKETVSEVSYEQLWQSMQKIASILKDQNIEGKIVGVQLSHCPALIAVIGGIIISGNGFSCLDSSWFEHLSPEQDVCTAYFLQDFESNIACDWVQPSLGMRILTQPLMFALSGSSRECFPEIAFCVKTSGSTGQPKTVLVPASCILPNVLSFIEQFALCDRDVIFVCSPPTFDPFVVDIVVGLRAGATLLLVDNCIRLNAKRLLGVLFPGVTVMQMTPSMFTRWSKSDVMLSVFGPSTTLRALVLGGERFPELHRPVDCAVSVYNVYGVTEVSCWSTIYKVPPNHEAEVPLGNPLDESIILQIRNPIDGSITDQLPNGSITGHLYIGSRSRKCVILGQSQNVCDTISNEPLFRETGDLVELSKEGNYYYRGRCNRTIKRFGCRVSLTELETILQTHPSVEQCASCFINEHNRVVIFFKSDSDDPSLRGTLWNIMRDNLRVEKLPDELHHIEEFPLSDHGKICLKGLIAIYEDLKKSLINGCNSPVEYFSAELKAMGILPETNSVEDNRMKKLKPNASFMDRGGTSFAALSLHAALEDNFKTQLPGLMALLVDPSVPLKMAINYVETNVKPLHGNVLNEAVKIHARGEKLLSISRQYDMKKCIDSRTSIIHFKDFGSVLSVGSHSGMLLTINIDTNVVISRTFLPDRIECTVSFFELNSNRIYGVVGCYDGFLYCFNPLKNEDIVWKYDAGGMIKCAPLVLPRSNLIIIGSYSTSHNLHCIVAEISGIVFRWKVRIGTKPILSQPVPADDETEALILVATLDGTIAAVNTANGCVVWERTTSRNVPIFSTPTLLPEYNRIVCCSVDGTLGIYDTVTGTEVTYHTLPGNVFSSMVALKHPHDCVDLIIGCYDRHVHCVEYSPTSGEKLVAKWKIEVQSQIYATPMLIGCYLVVCTTSGWLNLLDLRVTCHSKNSIIGSIKLNGELFASPVAFDKRIFIGCRDNFLYEIQLND